MSEPIPANEPTPIILAKHLDAAVAANIGRPTVAIGPDYNTTWNDFGRYYHAKMWILLEHKPTVELKFLLMIQGALRTDSRLDQILGTREWSNISDEAALFCSVFDNIDSYREIVALLGFDRAITVLRQLGDAVVVQLEGIDSERLELISTPDFYLGALRQDSAFVAFRKGKRHLRPDSSTATEDAATSFFLKTILPPANNEYEIEFDFEPDELFRNRASVLIGKNGTGKTQLLLSIIKGLRKTGGQDEQTTLDPPPSLNRLIVFSSVASDPYPQNIPPWQGVDYQYFSMIANNSTDQNTLTGAIVDCLRDDGKIAFLDGEPFVPRGRITLLEKSMIPLGIWKGIHFPLNIREAEYDLPRLRTWAGKSYFPLEHAANLMNSAGFSSYNRLTGNSRQWFSA
ncbi:MAG: hypothetical protein JWL86_5976 [Rhizobium sp.]|nr:hypothetical protein [Rhizobium sp.]